MSDAHPSFSNPSIAEVVCDLHFRLPRGKEWRAEFFSELHNRIRENYPAMEPVAEMQMQVVLGPLGLQQRMVQSPPKVRFRHSTRPLLLQYTENNLTVNVLPKYPGWERVLQDVLVVWECVREVVEPRWITRIGLRYINRIPREIPGEAPGNWLRACEYIPAALLDSRPGFLMRMQVQIDGQNRIILTTTDATEGEGQPGDGPIVFDIDRIVEREIAPKGTTLSKQLNELHNHVWNVFESVQTEKLTQLLSREG